MDFLDYLKSKNIDPEKLRKHEPDIFGEYTSLFGLLHPDSFTAQKLFMINKLRRKYLLDTSERNTQEKKVSAPKPKIMARPKPKPPTA